MGIINNVLFFLLKITSLILNKLIELRWWGMVGYVLEFRKKFLIIIMKKTIKNYGKSNFKI
jgi:hypothetical protein